jgi:hypothetical protein
MGKASRDKGARVERLMVNMHKSAGILAERVPLSGAVRGQRAGDGHDIDVYTDRNGDAPLCGEIKARKELPKWQAEALGDNDFLILKGDRQGPTVTVPWHIWIKLLGGSTNEPDNTR